MGYEYRVRFEGSPAAALDRVAEAFPGSRREPSSVHWTHAGGDVDVREEAAGLYVLFVLGVDRQAVLSVLSRLGTVEEI